jgi:hypothetical protein
MGAEQWKGTLKGQSSRKVDDWRTSGTIGGPAAQLEDQRHVKPMILVQFHVYRNLSHISNTTKDAAGARLRYLLALLIASDVMWRWGDQATSCWGNVPAPVLVLDDADDGGTLLYAAFHGSRA